MQLSIVIVTWNCEEFIFRCLSSIYRNSSQLSFEIILVDNASSDKIVETVSRKFPDVIVIVNEKNLGFPKANNIGFARARGEYLLALNPDTEVQENTLLECVRFLDENEKYGCVGVKTIKPNAEIQLHCARQFPTLRSFFFSYYFLDKIFPAVRFFRSTDMPYWDHMENRDVDMIQGAFMMFRRRIYEEIGGFDERIPMFLEDGEYCLRLSRHKQKIRYLAEVSIIHHIGQSAAKSPPPWIAQLRYEANYQFLVDYSGRHQAVLYVFVVFIGSLPRLLLLPFLDLGLRIRKGESRLRMYIWETLAGWLWSTRKLFRLLVAAHIDQRLHPSAAA